MPEHTVKERDKNTVNNEATRLAGTAPEPLVSDIELRNQVREELRRAERGRK